MPIVVMANPPSVGPIARLMLKLVLLVAIALSRSGLGTSIGVISNQAGAASAPPTPREKLVRRSGVGVAKCSETRTAKPTELATTAVLAPINRLHARTKT